MRNISKPPADLDSFIGRKWLESLVNQNQEFNNFSNLTFLLLANDPLLPNARRLVGSANVTLTDAGIGSTLTLNLSDTGVTPGSYTGVDLIVDAKGRITSIANGTTISSTLPHLNPNAGPVYLTQVEAPTVCTATLAGSGAGNVTNGVHKYKISFVTANGETELGYHVPEASVTVVNNAADGKVSLTNIALGGAGDGVTARKIYRTWAGGTIFYLLATIADNTTTTYLDNDTDSSGINYTFRPNTTAALWLETSLGRTRILAYPGVQNVSWGVDALQSITSGFWNTSIGEGTMASLTTGQQNTAVGIDSQNRSTAGSMNVTLGIDTLYHAQGSYNVAVGSQAGVILAIGDYNVLIGKDAGITQTAGDNNILIGYSTAALDPNGSNQINIGNVIVSDGLVLTLAQDTSVPDEAYGVSWDGSLEVPTKNALYDKIEAIVAGVTPPPSLLRSFFFGGA